MTSLRLIIPTLSVCHGSPDDREKEARAQLQRPAFSRVADLAARYLPYSELERNRETMARFGTGLNSIEAVARRLQRDSQ